MGAEIYCEKRMRTRRVKGSEEDAGKWVRCQNCGFILDITKVSTGTGSGIVHEEFADIPMSPVSSGDPKLVQLYLDTFSTVGGVIQNGADSEPITDYYLPRKAVAVSGCPFCGCKNLS